MIYKKGVKTWLTRKTMPGPNKKGEIVTHMLVISAIDNSVYHPVYLCGTDDVQQVIDKYNQQNAFRVVEVYSYALDRESQLQENQTWHTL